MDKDLRQDIADGRHVKVPPLARAVNVTANSLYDAIQRGEVASVRIGKSVRVPASEAKRLLVLEA